MSILSENSGSKTAAARLPRLVGWQVGDRTSSQQARTTSCLRSIEPGSSITSSTPCPVRQLLGSAERDRCKSPTLHLSRSRHPLRSWQQVLSSCWCSLRAAEISVQQGGRPYLCAKRLICPQEGVQAGGRCSSKVRRPEDLARRPAARGTRAWTNCAVIVRRDHDSIASSRSPASYKHSRPSRSRHSSAVHGSISAPQRLSR
jgi:hypothetical protein